MLGEREEQQKEQRVRDSDREILQRVQPEARKDFAEKIDEERQADEEDRVFHRAQARLVHAERRQKVDAERRYREHLLVALGSQPARRIAAAESEHAPGGGETVVRDGTLDRRERSVEARRSPRRYEIHVRHVAERKEMEPAGAANRELHREALRRVERLETEGRVSGREPASR